MNTVETTVVPKFHETYIMFALMISCMSLEQAHNGHIGWIDILNPVFARLGWNVCLDGLFGEIETGSHNLKTEI